VTIPLLTTSWTVAHRAHKAANRTFVPVRASLGSPKFWPEAKALPYIAELAPAGLFHLDDTAEFERRYLARLDRIGVDRLAARFADVYAEYQRSLALCCFEPAGQPCHRRLWAAWHEEHTGQSVPELEPGHNEHRAFGQVPERRE